MWLPDVNVLLYAFRPSSEFHASSAKWLEKSLSGGTPVLFSEITELGFLRISTQFSDPLPTFEEAWDFLESIRKSSLYLFVSSGQTHREEFFKLAKTTNLTGKHLTDLWLAALAIENNATIVSYDRDFKKIPNLKTLQPT